MNKNNGNSNISIINLKNSVLSFLRIYKPPKTLISSLFIVSLYIFVLIFGSGFSSVQIITMTFFLIIALGLPILENVGNEYAIKIIKLVFTSSAPLAIFYFVERYMHDPFDATPMKVQALLLNLGFYYSALLLVTAITTRTDVAFTVITIVPMVLGIANNISMQTRDLPIYPWDILSAKTAMTVVDNYHINFTPSFLFATFSLIAIIIISYKINIRLKYKLKWLYFVPVIASVIIFSSYIAIINSIFRTEANASKKGFYPYLFSASYLYKYNGTPVSFIYTLKFLNLSPPQGYDIEDIEKLYTEYQEKAKADAEEKKDAVRPNIIVIMNEAFSDPSILGDFRTNTSYMPFISSLVNSGEAVMGNVMVSVKGGNTPNSEFEFLTGTSMAFLPSGSIPYQQYIDGKTQTFVSQMNSLGYYTIGMHNYHATGWERNEIYQDFGFDKIMFNEDMKYQEFIRSYLSDYSLYKEIFDIQESKSKDDPMFLFAVTMQNHGDYPNSKNGNFIPSVNVLDNNFAYVSYLNNYLSLIRESDYAFEKLINYYENCDEPTVILMFGDHQPNDHVVSPILKANGINLSSATLEQQQGRYFTPYIMWSNYDIDMSGMPERLSLNYLAAILADACDIPLTPFQLWQMEMFNEYPMMNAFCYVDKNGVYHSVADIKNINILQTLNKIQYNLVFDRKQTVKKFFDVVSAA